MTKKERILEALKEAMKQGEKDRVTILRTLHAAIKQVEVDTRTELSDEAVEQVVQRQVKQLQDALTDFETAGRTDLVDQNRAEIELLTTFLPEQLSDEELQAVVAQVVVELGADAPFGQLMGAVMKEVSGRADGNRVRHVLESVNH